MRPLGKNQLTLLKAIGTNCALVCSNKEAVSLEKRGFLKDDGNGAFYRITPNGLRALADAVEAGRIRLFEGPRTQAAIDARDGG